MLRSRVLAVCMRYMLYNIMRHMAHANSPKKQPQHSARAGHDLRFTCTRTSKTKTLRSLQPVRRTERVVYSIKPIFSLRFGHGHWSLSRKRKMMQLVNVYKPATTYVQKQRGPQTVKVYCSTSVREKKPPKKPASVLLDKCVYNTRRNI